jgi:hypothetical protein
MRGRPLLFSLAILCWAFARPAEALPTMIRLGYTNCAACHIAPQGGGLLNNYGRGIDEAQSLRADEYVAGPPGRIFQDVRSVTQYQLSTTTGKPVTSLLRSRLMYRNSTEFLPGLRFTGTVAIENESSARPSLSYDPAINPRAYYKSDEVTFRGYLMTALLAWRPEKNLEIEAGRDQLPSGVNIADLTAFVRARDRQGYYDSPSQVKLFWWGKRHQVTPYFFGPSGTEKPTARERGGGALAEYDLLGKGRTIVGVNILRANATIERRMMYGSHARLGFGKWGILAENDISQRSYLVGGTRDFLQTATYAQAFWAAREWLVLSTIGERLKVDRPFQEGLAAGRFEVAARLSSNFTVTAGVRVQRNLVNGQQGPAATIQLAMKPVLPSIWRTN